MAQPIELHLYDENDEIIKTFKQSTTNLKFGFLKRAVKLQTQIDEAKASGSAKLEDLFDIMGEFAMAFFGNGLTIQDLEDHATFQEVYAVLQAITSRANALSGPENFQPGQG